MTLMPNTWIIIVFVYGLLLSVTYNTALTQMVKSWNQDAYSHCFLVPFITAYLIWKNRGDIATLPSVTSWKGLILLGFGAVLFWLGELGAEYYTLYISLWLTTVGLCWMHLGSSKLKLISFPLAFSLTMFPLPYFLNTTIALRLRIISSKLATFMIQSLCLPVYRQGNIIDLGFIKLQMLEACSGLNYLISLLVLCLLLSYQLQARLWKKVYLVLSAIPLAIFANSIRITLTALLSYLFGTDVAEKFYDSFSGFFIFIGCIFFILFEIWLLKKPFSLTNSIDTTILATKSLIPPDGVVETTLEKHTDKSISGRFLFIVALILIGSNLVFSQIIELRKPIHITKPLKDFPLRLGRWSGIPAEMEQRFVDFLGFHDYLIVSYKEITGEKIDFYVAYYESQYKGKATHTPESCIPGSGWTLEDIGPIDVPTPGHGTGFIAVNRAIIQQDEDKQLVYFWFPQRGRILTNAYQVKFYNFWDSVTMRRTDGAAVRTMTRIYSFEDLAKAESRLQRFVAAIVPLLDEHIPGKSIVHLSNNN